MKVKYKKGTSNFGFDGQEYPADENNEADLPPEALAAAIEFGVLAGPDEQPEQDESGNKGADEALAAEQEAFENENAARLNEILKGNVGEVTEALADLDPKELALLAKLELLGQGRKGVAEAIAEELENTKDQ